MTTNSMVDSFGLHVVKEVFKMTSGVVKDIAELPKGLRAHEPACAAGGGHASCQRQGRDRGAAVSVSGCCSLTVFTSCSPWSPLTSTASSWTTPSRRVHRPPAGRMDLMCIDVQGRRCVRQKDGPFTSCFG